MSTLDDLQSAAHQVSTDVDSSIAALGQLRSDNDDAVQDAVAWGNEGGAQVLDGPGRTALDNAKQAAQTFQEKLSEYVAVVEQAKGGG